MTNENAPLLNLLAEQKGLKPESLLAFGAHERAYRHPKADHEEMMVAFPMFSDLQKKHCVGYHFRHPVRQADVKAETDPEKRKALPRGYYNEGSVGFLVPDNLPPILDYVVLAEGESDAAAATQAGLLAIGVPGAGCFPSNFTNTLKGLLVYIVFDCDEAARKLSQSVAGKLAGIASEIRIVDLDPKNTSGYDLRNYLAEHSAEDFGRFVSSTTVPFKPEKERKAKKKKDDKKKIKYIETAYYELPDEWSLSLAYEPKEDKVFFLHYNSKTEEMKTIDYYELSCAEMPSGEELITLVVPPRAAVGSDEPCHMLNSEHPVVRPPSGVEEYGTRQDLFNEVRAFINLYYDMPTEFEILATWYVFFTYVYRAFDVLPYLRFLGDTGSGKSRAIKTVGALCYMPCMIAGNVNEAGLFRLIDLYKGTVVIDEADLQKSDLTEHIVKVLNCGFSTDNPAIRCDAMRNWRLEPFNVFGPKILATRKRWKDAALESRCITHITMARKRAMPLNLVLRIFHDKALSIRNKLTLWSLRTLHKITLNTDVYLPGVEDRLNQIFAPLASVIGKDDPDALESLANTIKTLQSGIIEDRGDTLTAEILAVIFGWNGVERLTVNEIAEAVNTTRTDKDRPVNSRLVSRIARGADIALKTQHSRDGTVVVWDEARIEYLKTRYGYQATEEEDLDAVFDDLRPDEPQADPSKETLFE